MVHLVSLGVGARDYRLSAGATLADLLRVSGASVAKQAVFLDGISHEEAVPLHSGMVVTIVPRPKYADHEEPWRATIPAFADAAFGPLALQNGLGPSETNHDP